MALRILRTNHDGLTGHLTFLVRVEEETAPGQISHGPEETIGIWPRALMTGYHGPAEPTGQSIKQAITKWLAERHGEALTRKRHAELTAQATGEFKGQLIDFR